MRIHIYICNSRELPGSLLCEIMGKILRRSTDREETPKPQRKRRKKDLDRIHSKILRAKRKLDNVGKSDNKAEQKKQGQTKICNRLLPEPAAGIYRNGTKGKDIQKAETLENTFHKARLKADALKLFNGDTHESKHIVEIPAHNKTTKQSPNKNCMKNCLEWTPCISEQSPVLGKKQSQNQKPCLAKKKDEENIFKGVDSNKTEKQNVNDKSRHVQKEKNICKRRLFQNDREQLETITTPTQIFDNTDLIKKNKTNEKETELCSKNSKNSSCDPLSRYMEFCKIISIENFEEDILQNYSSDPATTTIKRLRQVYTDSFRQQLLRRKNKGELESVYSVEHQACTSDTSQLSPIEFEVPKCSENHIIATRLQKGSQQDKLHLIQNARHKKSDGITRYSPTSCSSRNTFITYKTNGSIVENCENSDTQYSKQFKDIRQLSKSSFYFANEKDSLQLDSQTNPNYVNHLLKSKQNDKDNFSLDISGYSRNSRRIDNSKHLGTSMFLSDSTLPERHFLKDYSHEKLPIAVADDCVPNNVPKKCNNNNRTANKCNVKNVKRVPTILRRCNDITINKPNQSVQMNGNYAEGIYKEFLTNLFNRSPNNDIEKELHETTFPNGPKNLATSSTMNAMFDQTKILEPQIGSMKIKDSQESQIEQFDINTRSKEHNERNKFCRYNDSLYSRSFETPYNTNVYGEKLPQEEQISSPDIRKHFFHPNNHRTINYLQGVNFSNSNAEPTKQQFSQQTKLHVCETNKQEFFRKNTHDQNQNILFNNVDGEIPQNIQTEKRSTEAKWKNPDGRENLFVKTNVECAKNRINQNVCHCNEQYIYFDSANCPRNYKEQAHYFHKETAQPENLRDTRSYNNSIDNCINSSSTMRNVSLLSLKQQNNLYTYPKDDQHRAVLLQNVTQPIKYLAVKNGSDIQRIPVYINDKSVRVAENFPLKVIALMDPNTQTKAFPQEIATQVLPLQTDSLPFNDFATRKINDQSFIKHLDSANAILFNPDLQSNIWYASNL